MSEMLFILFLALIILGPRKVPGIARQVGRLYAEFNHAKQSFTSQIMSEIDAIDSPGVSATLGPAPPPQNHFAPTASGAATDYVLANIGTP